jgi:hypothetical protein
MSEYAEASSQIRRSAEEVRLEWEAAHPGYKIAYTSGYGNGTPECERCGSVVVNTTLHDGWHLGLMTVAKKAFDA